MTEARKRRIAATLLGSIGSRASQRSGDLRARDDLKESDASNFKGLT
jgi:hypothetical protein